MRMFSMREEDKEESMMQALPGLDRIDSKSVRNSHFAPRQKKSLSQSERTSEQRESGPLAHVLELPQNEQTEEGGTEMGRMLPLRENSESEEEKSSNGSAEDERGGGAVVPPEEEEKSPLQKKGRGKHDSRATSSRRGQLAGARARPGGRGRGGA